VWRTAQLERKAMTAKRLGSSIANHKAARSGSGPVARSAGADASTLATYLQETHAYDVLDAKQEIAIAQAIEERELAHWRVLVSHAPTLEVVETAVATHFEVPRELTAVRKLAHSKRRTSQTWKASVERCAASLRELDSARVALFDADMAVRAYLDEKGGGGSFLNKLNDARRAQQEAKNRFMTANLRLVVSLARRYETGLLPLADLIQEGNLGLMRAVERFDHRRGFRFSTYATWWIRHGFNRALSDKGRLVRLPVHLLDDAQRVARAYAELTTANHGEPPSLAELGKKTGISEDKLALIQLHATGRPTASLDRKLSDDSESSLMDILPDPEVEPPEESIDAERWNGKVASLLSKLEPIEAAILRFRFGLDDGEELTLEEVGAKYNLSRERIRQLQQQALHKLRHVLHDNQAPGDRSAA
jgi:RNA polymerase primary sigma factor